MKLKKVFKNPKDLAKRIYYKYYLNTIFEKERKNSFKKFLYNLSLDYKDYLEISEEIINDKVFNASINKEFKETGIDISFPIDNICWPYFLYYLIRKKKPEIVVETGVWYGISTSVILKALNENKKGFLYSIDLPAYFEDGGYTDENPYLSEEERTSSLPPSRSPGFIVSDYLKDRWKLILGDSKIHLPILLEQLGKIDIFLHDSLHSYENMTFEFNIARKH
ncbi:MAG: class I SAM-dependent methyltransferase, partial [Ignavibacteriae bacterium]|nr:class I SAM-dependent methyltransferase [Ignavibacteriota bacterium]